MRAGITWSGDIDPADPTTWTTSTDGYIGKTGAGTLNINNGSNVLDGTGTIGYNPGTSGEVTVEGSGSTWTNNSGPLYVGYEGSGTLNIIGGGAVTVENNTRVSLYSGSSGTIHFDYGTLTTGGLLCGSDDLTGTGTINTHGLVSEVDLVFDATHGLDQAFNINDNPGQNITVNLNVDGSSNFIGAGYRGVGTMSISDGIIIESFTGYIGWQSGSTGEVTVDGPGSTWTNGNITLVGENGSGTLNITNGGAVINNIGRIGDRTGSTGEVTVDGPGSTWTNNSRLGVGYHGSGTLNITDGGLVSVAGILTIDIDKDEDGFINMATGGMLALYGNADDSLTEFLGLIDGTGTYAIRYWDDSISDWADITGATYGQDYNLTYLTEGDLAGYTRLTVTAVPEPATLSLFALGTVTMIRRKRAAGCIKE